MNEDLLAPEAAESMLTWPHSGFHVHHRVRIETEDAEGRTHLPRQSDVYIRYYGAYSVRRRAAWRKAGIRPRQHRLPVVESPESLPESLRARRRRWAELLRRIWNVQTCPRCGGGMTILAFTLDPAVIDATLRRLGHNGHDPRAGPWAPRAPPASTPP